MTISLRHLILVGFCASSVAAGGVRYESTGTRKQCTVTPLGGSRDDVPNILEAFNVCGNDGVVVFPEGNNYTIAQKLNPVLNNCEIQWRGTWTMTADLDYWRNNSYYIPFQNHWAGIVFSGDHISIDGYGTGGINGNGDVWYTAEAGVTQPGRPMAFVWWNASDVTVRNFEVKDSPLWSLNIMNGTDMWFDNIKCNATSTQAPFGENWVQNTDGFDTMDAKNIFLSDFYYQGGDDCIALKPRSYNIYANNLTCHGGNGIAIGSLGQYLEDSSVENVEVSNVNLIRYNDDLTNSAYIKTWIGVPVPQSSYESGGVPRGGGWGSVKNVIFSNFTLRGPDSGPAINENSGSNGSFAGSSLMDISNVVFQNFTGFLNGETTEAGISCSEVHPCYNIVLRDVNITASANSTSLLSNASCDWVQTGGVVGSTCV
ncbi:putative galacturan 1,4-alpha-galacturonidase C [Xylariaceae sp. FL0804]|nr:putative galacturan 1,4-alpha-galacturonidase C [Xylariaceae sp. FL0804]